MLAEATDLRLRPLSDLLGERFFVPSYQRGYRWTPTQVSALLDDLEDFVRSDPTRDSYYCLQPVVVRQRQDGSWDLVDGQQRLTTLYLLLGCLEEVARLLGKGRYQLAYETRDSSAGYLDNPTEDPDNIDFHHMWRARAAILEWFERRDGNLKVDFVQLLTRPNGQGANVRVIWYELSPEADARQAFIRLNVGRIPLTSAELIRALLLRAADDNAEESRRRRQIASEWDAIEKRLHDAQFWGFLVSSTQEPPARIEFLFSLFVRARRPEIAAHTDELSTFWAFQEWLDDFDGSAWEAWLTFRNETIQILDEWFEDRTLYHLVGVLVAVAPDGGEADSKVLADLVKARQGRTGTDFDRYLRGQAWRRLLGSATAPLPTRASDLERKLFDHLAALRYGNATGQLRTTLLLFNVAGTLAHTAPTHRFRFDGFKANRWDIEHIRSVTEYIPAGPRQRKDWLQHALQFVASPAGRASDPAAADALSARMQALLEQPAPDASAFEEVFQAVRVLSGEGEARESDHQISNLVLLDMGTNRSYRNAIFPAKRRRIIELDTEGVYVPPATRNVFLKYFNPDAGQVLLWDADDQVSYGRAVRGTLLAFFRPLAETA
jgi:hypothetical protein